MALPFAFRPFQENAREELLSFVEAHPLPAFDADEVRAFLDGIISGPHCVLDLWSERERVAVAMLIDTCDNPSNSGELALVSARPELLPPPACELLVDRAEEVLRTGKRTALDITAGEHSPLPAGFLQKRGYTEVYRMLRMRRELAAEPARPEEKRWRDLDSGNVKTYFEVLREDFRSNIETNIPAFETFREGNLAAKILPRLLFENGELAAFTKVRPLKAEAGEIVIVGRHPARRAQGLGEKALAEAMRLLRAHGMKTVFLSVLASNRPAVALYLKRGFTVARTDIVLRRAMIK